jgi:hypothetical membrane protein
VTPTRLRTGALVWLLTVQFFAVETIAAAQMTVPYSRTDNTISVLGATDSPAYRLMDFSFLLMGVLIIGGALLLRPALRGRAAQVAPTLLTLAGIGVMIVGIFPRDIHPLPHAVGVVAYLVGAGFGLVSLAYGVRPRSEVLGTVLALFGLVTTAMSIFFLAGVTQFLGLGGTERAAGYPLPIALAIAGAALWRMGFGAPGDAAAVTTARDERALERELEKARKAEQRRARDEALEQATRRSEPKPPIQPEHEGASVGAGASDIGEDDDPEDPWATPVRRRD